MIKVLKFTLVALMCINSSISVNAQCVNGKYFSQVQNAQPEPPPNDGCIALTQASNSQKGCAWDVDSKIDFASNFSYDFKIFLGASDGGADGMCFVIHNDPAALCACGGVGASMGAGGIQKSLIIEIDTYVNTDDRDDGLAGISCSSGPDIDHMDLWLNGQINQSDGAACPCQGPPLGACTNYRNIPSAVQLKDSLGANYNIENNKLHWMNITWQALPTAKLKVSIMNMSKTTTYGTVTYSNLNPTTLFGTNSPYFGFTASTGGLNNKQMFCLPVEFVLPIKLWNFDVVGISENLASLNIYPSAEWKQYEYVTIQHSTDARNWEDLVIVNSADLQEIKSFLNFQLRRGTGGMDFYRLESTDFSGKKEYSKSKRINQFNSQRDLFTIGPNPANEQLELHVVDPDIEGVYKVYSSEGRELLSGLLEKGSLVYKIDINSFANGIYSVECQTNAGYSSRKVLVNK